LAAIWIFSASAQAQGFGWRDWLHDRIFGHSEEPAAALERLGGLRILFGLDAEALRKSMLIELQDNTRRLLREAHIGFMDLAITGESLEVRVREGNDLQQALIKLDEASPGGAVEVRDVGDRLVRLTPTEAGVNERTQASLRRSIEIIERRLSELGIDASGVQEEGGDRILVLLPGVKDPARVARLITSRGRLAFRLVDVSVSPQDVSDGRAPPDSDILRGFKSDKRYAVKKQVLLGSEDLTEAAASIDQRTQEPIVSFSFNARGTQRFAHITQENVGQPFAMVLDDEVISAPIIREPILGGRGQIAGNFTIEEALNLSILLQSGTLPVRLNLIEQRVVAARSPTGQ
jgi:preprotein translocase subunit SecD